VSSSEPRSGIPEAISRSLVIAIGRRLDPSTVPSIGVALASGGIRAFEVTMNSESALEVIRELTKRFSPDGSGDAAVGRERAAVISRSLADAGNRQLNAKR
jgi:2-keto-3-deoxy-6-phosphogluconate aldolase